MEDKIDRAERWYRSDRGHKFLRELWSIVLGVLIALMLGAVATWVGWKIDVADAKSSLADEMGEIVGQAREREGADKCIEAKLDAIGRVLDAADKAGRLPPTGPIGSPMYRTWSRGVWDSTVSAETASHFDRDTLDNLSGAYQFVDIINRRSEQEVEAWTRLYAIVGPGRTTSPAEIADLRSALSQARMAHRYTVLSGIRLDQVVQAFGLPVNKDSIKQHDAPPPARTCGPIEKPDGRGYGQAPLEGVVTRARANPITRNSIGALRR